MWDFQGIPHLAMLPAPACGLSSGSSIGSKARRLAARRIPQHHGMAGGAPVAVDLLQVSCARRSAALGRATVTPDLRSAVGSGAPRNLQDLNQSCSEVNFKRRDHLLLILIRFGSLFRPPQTGIPVNVETHGSVYVERRNSSRNCSLVYVERRNSSRNSSRNNSTFFENNYF